MPTLTELQQIYRDIDARYQDWKRANPGVDAWGNPTGSALARARDRANDELARAERPR